MCMWCENGRLVREISTPDGFVEKDYSKYLHEPEGYVPDWWYYQNEKSLRVLAVEKKKAPPEVSAEELEEKLQEQRKNLEARAEQCLEDGRYMCLNPVCGREIGRLKAVRGGFCSRCYQRVKRWQKKKRLVEYKGGECERCGVTPEYIAAFDFHHRDPDEKSFNVGMQINRAEDVLREEVDKCDLLCANCHREVEQGFHEEAYSLFEDRV